MAGPTTVPSPMFNNLVAKEWNVPARVLPLHAAKLAGAKAVHFCCDRHPSAAFSEAASTR